MSFDALCMHAVRDELETLLLGGHIEKVVPLSDLEMGLRVRSCHRDYNLLMSADPQSARLHLVGGTLRRLTDQVTPFVLLMRKYVRGGRIASVDQPTLERVVKLTVEKRHEDGSTTTCAIIIEAMGRHSNVILVGPDGRVLDAIKRVPSSLSRQRPVLPHLPYSPPPATEKLNPLSPLLARQLAAASRQVGPASPLWRFLQESVTGLGPLSAREVVHRATGNVASSVGQAPSWERVADTLVALLRPLETREWAPTVVVRDGEVIHFAPYSLTQFPESQLERVASISEAVERAHAEKLRLRPGEALRAPLRASLQERLERVRRREESLRHALARGERAEGLKKWGQAILASVSQIRPGQVELAWEGETIALDPRLSPSENAQRYFKEYAKARDASREIPALLEAARLEREYLEQMLALADLAEDEVELRTISRELAEATSGAGAGSRSTSPRPRPHPRQRGGKQKADQPAGTVKRFTSSDGCQILVGGSARGNERVTFQLGTASDLWLHARGVPGAHVVLKLGGREPPRGALLEAARLAARHSQARDSTRVPVDYTLLRYVKKVKGGPPGLVTYTQERTVRVDPTGESTSDE